MTLRAPSARRHGKKHAAAAAKVTQASYTLEEAMALLPLLSTTSFDGSAELHVRLGIDPTQSDQLVRATVALPHGTGREVRIAAFVREDNVKAVKEAGALHVGGADLIAEIAKGMLDFDVAIAEPTLMKELGKVAKVLGPKGLMPSPKSGTVSADPVSVTREIHKGRVEFRTDKQGIIHCVFGKLSFGPEKLCANLQVLLQSITEAKPDGLKGDYIKSITVSPTMGPGVRVKV